MHTRFETKPTRGRAQARAYPASPHTRATCTHTSTEGKISHTTINAALDNQRIAHGQATTPPHVGQKEGLAHISTSTPATMDDERIRSIFPLWVTPHRLLGHAAVPRLQIRFMHFDDPVNAAEPIPLLHGRHQELLRVSLFCFVCTAGFVFEI